MRVQVELCFDCIHHLDHPITNLVLEDKPQGSALAFRPSVNPCHDRELAIQKRVRSLLRFDRPLPHLLLAFIVPHLDPLMLHDVQDVRQVELVGVLADLSRVCQPMQIANDLSSLEAQVLSVMLPAVEQRTSQ